MTKINGKITLPRCWKNLIKVDTLKGTKDAANNRKRLDDPTPYYDDNREMTGTFENGNTFFVGLMSGQSNYWGGVIIYSKESESPRSVLHGDILYGEDEPMESFGDTVECEAEGNLYIISITWVDVLEEAV